MRLRRVTYHRQEQSKFISIHLFGLKLNESQSSRPFTKCLNSGQMSELPAYAPSTCR